MDRRPEIRSPVFKPGERNKSGCASSWPHCISQVSLVLGIYMWIINPSFDWLETTFLQVVMLI